MTALRHVLLLLLFIPLLGLSSCDKDEKVLTRTDLLVSHEWKGSKILVNGTDVSDRAEVKLMLPDIKTVRITFNRNGSYAASYTDASGQKTTTGSWKFSNDELKLSFDLLGEVEIKEFTADNLNLVTAVQYGPTSYKAEIQLIK